MGVLRGNNNNSVDPQPSQGKHFCTNLPPVQYTELTHQLEMPGPQMLSTSVAESDPDPDSVGSGLFGSPGSGSGKIPDPDPLSTKRLL